jgi:hypothetical protein
VELASPIDSAPGWDGEEPDEYADDEGEDPTDAVANEPADIYAYTVAQAPYAEYAEYDDPEEEGYDQFADEPLEAQPGPASVEPVAEMAAPETVSAMTASGPMADRAVPDLSAAGPNEGTANDYGIADLKVEGPGQAPVPATTEGASPEAPASWNETLLEWTGTFQTG